MLELRFTPEEIVSAFEKLSREDYETASMLISHHATSPLTDIVNLEMLTFDSSEYKLEDDMQRRLASMAIAKTQQTISKWRELGRLFERNLQQEQLEDIKTKAAEYYTTLSEFAQLFPIMPGLESIAELSARQRKLLNIADGSAQILIYTFNRLFNPLYVAQMRYLDRDIQAAEPGHARIFQNCQINFYCHSLQPFKTTKDYLTYVIEPLLWNAREHAFDENTKERHVTLRCYAETRDDGQKNSDKGFCYPAKNGMYVIEVADSGKGIDAETLNKIFCPGFTTKTDKTVEHGQGLDGVKRFVEANHGTITAESEYGKGTIFRVKLPYNKRESPDVCVQD